MKSSCITRLACNALKSVLRYSTIVVVVTPELVPAALTITDDNSVCPISFVIPIPVLKSVIWSVLKSVFNTLISWSLLNTSVG